jgi:type IV pilus assembly protein PilA
MLRRIEGFTLIELMIVVAIVGILASLAISNYMSFQCASKQAEAKANLGAIFLVEESYQAEYGTYLADINALGWAPRGNTRYAYTIVEAHTTAFTARAVADALDSDPTNDVWEIDETKRLTVISNDCGN